MAKDGNWFDISPARSTRYHAPIYTRFFLGFYHWISQAGDGGIPTQPVMSILPAHNDETFFLQRGIECHG